MKVGSNRGTLSEKNFHKAEHSIIEKYHYLIKNYMEHTFTLQTTFVEGKYTLLIQSEC